MALNKRGKGIILALLGGSFLGGSGVAGQYLLQDCGFATILSVWLLGQSFELMDIIGSLCILITVFILAKL